MKKRYNVNISQNPLGINALLLGFVGLAGLFSGLWAKDVLLDDAMITFRVAENLAYGRGFVYNVGEWVQVTTTPLYALTLALGSRLVGSAPQAALLLNITLSVLIPMLAYDLGRRISGRITGVGAGLLLVMAPLLLIAFSMESYLYVALILASIDVYVARRYSLAGIIIGATGLLRGDAILLGAVVLIYDTLLFRHLRWRLIMPAIGLPAVWYVFATGYYGSPFPATLQAKTAQGAFNWLGDYFVSGFMEIWRDWLEDYGPGFYLLPLFMLVGLLSILWRRSHIWLILIGYSLLYIATFEGLRVAFAEWYYAPLMPTLALLTAQGVQTVATALAVALSRLKPDSAIGSRWQAVISAVVAALLIAWLMAILYPANAEIVRSHPNWKAEAYPSAASWIAANTNSSATLATIDIGHLGYWSKRHMIDIVGLAQPDVAAQIAQGDFGYAIRQYQPDLVLLGALWLPEIQSQNWFQQSYTPRHSLRITGMAESLVLFSKQEGVKVNSDVVPPGQLKPLWENFNDQIGLRGYHITRPVTPGGLLNLTLVWQVLQPLELDFTVFVQVIDVENNIVAQGDGKPQQGFYGTTYWQPGEEITDLYSLPIPSELAAGQYDILLGFYEMENGNRLQVLDETGHFKADHVRLGGLIIGSAP